MTVWLIQCLCPDRHAICAVAGEADDRRAAEEAVVKPFYKTLSMALATDLINPWCGLCHAAASTWHCELAVTPFASMEEAEPFLKQSEAEQAKVREMWGDMKRND
jgi:hypothetical protein